MSEENQFVADDSHSFLQQIIAEFRANDGKVGGMFEGSTLTLLTTVGARSGQRRTVPLGYLEIDGQPRPPVSRVPANGRGLVRFVVPAAGTRRG